MKRTNQIYTAFCTGVSDQATTWIQAIHVPNEPRSNLEMRAAQQAKQECAEAWGCELKEVHCLGLAEGNIEIAYWDDVVV